MKKLFRVLGFLALMAAILAGMLLMFDGGSKGPMPLIFSLLGAAIIYEFMGQIYKYQQKRKK